MSFKITYEFDPNVYSEAQTVRYKAWNVGTAAAVGQAATGSIPFDDPGGTLEFKGWRKVRVYETTATPTLLWLGRIRDKHVRRGDSERGSLRTGADRWWDCDAIDQNTLMGARIIRGTSANRPAETAGERLTWLLGTAFTIFVDGGHVTYPSDALDANNYTGMTPMDVFSDCAQPGGYNFFALQVDDTGPPELFFMLPEDSDWASDVAISDDPNDYNGASVFAPSYDSQLDILDEPIAQGVFLPYAGSGDNAYVYVEDDAIGDEFAYVNKAAPMANVKSAAKALVIANRHLALSATEEEKITCTVHVPAYQANAIRPWHRVPYKSTWMPGFEEYRDCRVTQWSIEQQPFSGGGEGYLIHLEMSPIDETPALTCAVIISSSETEVASEDVTNDPAVSITPTGGGTLLAWLDGTNGNTPAATNMTAIAGGWTELHNNASMSRSTFRIAQKAATDGVTESADATFTVGFGGYNVWIAAAVHLSMAYSTPVQSKYIEPGFGLVLDSTPTVGNIILVFAFSDSLGSTGPMSGPNIIPENGPTTWTTLFTEYQKYENSEVGMAIFAHCVEEGEDGTYSWNGAGGYTTAQFTFVAEYAP